MLFVALQVSTERTSSRPKFLITSSLRITPLRIVTVLLLTSLSLRCQETVGDGLPAENASNPISRHQHTATQREHVLPSTKVRESGPSRPRGTMNFFSTVEFHARAAKELFSQAAESLNSLSSGVETRNMNFQVGSIANDSLSPLFSPA